MRKLAILLALLLAASASGQPITRIPASKVYVGGLAKDLETAISDGDIGSQTPWTAPVDASNEPLSGLKTLDFEPFTGSQISGSITWKDEAGIPFRLGPTNAVRNSGGSSAARDDLWQSSYNYNTAQTNINNLFRPAWIDTTESNWHAGGTPTTGLGTQGYGTIERYFNMQRAESTVEYNGATGGAFAAGQFINVRPDGGGAIIGNGILGTPLITPARLVIYWTDLVADAITPAITDDIEQPSDTTLTEMTTAFVSTDYVELYDSASCAGTPDGYAWFPTVAALVGGGGTGTQAVTVLQTQGLTSLLTSGFCVQQGANLGKLGTITPAGAANASSAFTQTQTSFRVDHQNSSYQDLQASWEIYPSKVFKDLNVRAFAMGVTNPTNHYPFVQILSGTGVSDAATDGYYVNIGDTTNLPVNVRIAGKLMLTNYSPGGASEIRSWGGSGTRFFTLPDATGDGPLAGFRTSDGGCVTGDMIVARASSVNGGVKCGAAPVAVTATGGIVYSAITVETALDTGTELCTAQGLTCVPLTVVTHAAPVDTTSVDTPLEWACGTDVGGSGLFIQAACN